VIKISVGQALLLLIDKYKNSPKSREVERLKKLYLSGPSNAEDRLFIKSLMQDFALHHYAVSDDAPTINSDPARRYFETHLAYESLKNSIGELNADDLNAHVNSLYHLVPPAMKDKVDKVLEGKIDDKKLLLYMEYADSLNKINSRQYYADFSEDDRKKIVLLIKSSFLSMSIVDAVKAPLDLYGADIFKSDRRGKVLKADQEQVTSQHQGLMQPHMPVPKNDIAFSDSEFLYLRGVDQSSFNHNAEWVKQNFELLMHPFANAISGTMLCQLRAFKLLANNNTLRFDDNQKMGAYLKCLISHLLYHSGGHSLHEFLSVLALPEVPLAFWFVDDFRNLNQKGLFYDNNKHSFDRALEAAIKYNSIILKKARVNQSVVEATLANEYKNYKNNDAKRKFILDAVYQGNLNIIRMIATVDRDYLLQITPAHIAAMQGDVDMMRLLAKVAQQFINQEDQNGACPATWAVEEGYEKVVAVLAEYGADFSLEDHSGNTPISIAIQENDWIMALCMLNSLSPEILAATLPTIEQDDIMSLSYHAAKNGYAKLIRELGIIHSSNFGECARIAACNGNAEVIREIGKIDKSFLEVQLVDGWTPAHFAADRGKWDVMVALAEAGANLNQDNGVGVTPAIVAVRQGHGQILTLLASQGIDLLAQRGVEGRGLAHYAVEYERPDVIGDLARISPAFFNQKDDHQFLAAHYAEELKNRDVVQALAKHGANFGILDGTITAAGHAEVEPKYGPIASPTHFFRKTPVSLAPDAPNDTGQMQSPASGSPLSEAKNDKTINTSGSVTNGKLKQG